MLCSEIDCVPSAIRETKKTLEDMKVSLSNLKSGSSALNRSLSDVKASIEQSLNEPECLNGTAEICSDIRLSLRQMNSNSDLGQVSRDWGPCAEAGPGAELYVGAPGRGAVGCVEQS